MVTTDDSEIFNNSVNNNLYFSDEYRIEQYKASAIYRKYKCTSRKSKKCFQFYLIIVKIIEL